MSGTAIGVILGCLIGLANAIMLWRLSAKYPALKVVALVEIIAMPLIGWAVGAFVLEGMI